jgi:hypothetical protein
MRDGRIRHVREYATKKEALEAAGLREESFCAEDPSARPAVRDRGAQGKVRLHSRWASSVAWMASDAILSLQRHVQDVREDLAPDVVRGLLEKGESLPRALDDGRNQSAPRRELLDQWRRGVWAGRRDADPVVGGVLGVTESAVAANEDHVGVARPVEVSRANASVVASMSTATTRPCRPTTSRARDVP